MSEYGHPLLTALEGVVPIKEIEIDGSMSVHDYNALIVDDTLFLACFYEGNREIALMVDTSREDYVVNHSEEDINECVECGEEGCSGVSIIGSTLEGEGETNVMFCDGCFDDFQREMDEVVEANADTVASNVL